MRGRGEGQRYSQEQGEGGSERKRWSEDWEECCGIDYAKGQKIREDESRMVVRPQGVRENMLISVFSLLQCLAPRLSERLAFIALSFVVKHCIREIARDALGC